MYICMYISFSLYTHLIYSLQILYYDELLGVFELGWFHSIRAYAAHIIIICLTWKLFVHIRIEHFHLRVTELHTINLFEEFGILNRRRNFQSNIVKTVCVSIKRWDGFKSDVFVFTRKKSLNRIVFILNIQQNYEFKKLFTTN